jgi:release factor glutamine methyltransferase
VNPGVLIPRPETEELVLLVTDHFKERNTSAPRLLDIGTGSGCISITLALEIPEATVFATDVSKEALVTATENAAMLDARVKFFNSDILTNDIPVGELDAIVSNPPYIPLSEKETMKNNVIRFEPSLALFVPDEDPMKFYKAICGRALGALIPGGLLVFEINERLGSDVVNVLTRAGFHNVQIVKDLFGKERIVKGLRP